MKPGRIFKDKQVIQLPSLTAVIEKDGRWFVSTCPELGNRGSSTFVMGKMAWSG